MSQPLEFRIAQLEASVEHLSGAFEQIDKRLGDLRMDVIAGFARVDQGFDSIERRMDLGIDRLTTWMLGQTGVILGAIAAAALALRH